MSITNNDSPLVDNTGNRRFLVVKPTLKANTVGDVVWLRAYRNQIFAEAVHKYQEMKRMQEELEAEVETLENQADSGEMLYKALEKQNLLNKYEMRLSDFGITKEEAAEGLRADEFVTPYGVPMIPFEISEDAQTKARMRSVVEEEIQAILNSYDEYRACHDEFFITSQEVYNQISEEAIRQSRFGSFALAEAARLIPIVDERLDKYRARSGSVKNQRGYKFLHCAPDAEKRLAAIKRLRSRADSMKPMPPSQFGGGSKAVTTDQKTARIRWEREGDAYLVISEDDIEREMETPSSVDISSMVYQDDF